MAVVFMEGFDHLSAAQLGNKNWTTSGTINKTTGRFGGQCVYLRTDGLQGTLYKLLPTTYNTVIFGMALYISNSALIGRVFGHLTTAGISSVLQLTTVNSGGNKLRLLNGSGTTLYTSSSTIPVGAWFQFEVKVTFNATTGSVDLHLNGISDGSATNVNTGSSDAAVFYMTSSGGDTGGSGSIYFAYDDIYVLDTTGSAPRNDFLGDCRVETLALNAEGTNTGWTANTGTKVAAIDQTTSYDSDTDYIYNGTSGTRQTFSTAALGITTGNVYAVQTNIVARKDDTATRQVAPVIRSGSTNYDGTSSAGLGAGYVVYSQIYNQNPDSTDWTISSVNAAEYGVKVV